MMEKKDEQEPNFGFDFEKHYYNFGSSFCNTRVKSFFL